MYMCQNTYNNSNIAYHQFFDDMLFFTFIIQIKRYNRVVIKISTR